ncbi:MAG TPA: hypothetical protein VFM93_11100 [Candidatus Limnocylindria bacterium]|nr:hypothetical protein [Candidatus Limnocylindria bacterium]
MRQLSATVLAILCACTASAPVTSVAPVGAVPASATFVSGAELVVGGAEVEGRACGLAREHKIGGRVDPPTQGSDGTWRVSGCFYSHRNELWQTQVVLLFDAAPGAGGQRLTVIPVREFVAKDHHEVPFGATLRDASVSRLRAFLVAYVN